MARKIEPKNVSAQLFYEAQGNPPGAHPRSAVGNFFPGLEFNFMNVWKRILIGIQLLESSGEVIGVDSDAPTEVKGQDLKGDLLLYVDAQVNNGQIVSPGTPVVTSVKGPSIAAGGTKGPVTDLLQTFLEWGNALSGIHLKHGGKNSPILCLFQSRVPNQPLKLVSLKVRNLLDQDTALISTRANEPGELTESLCSPWQTDFIGCACYYWAANRPDFINVEISPTGASSGHNWLNWRNGKRETDPTTQRPLYTLEPSKTLKHEDIMQNWEEKLRFVIGGQEEKK